MRPEPLGVPLQVGNGRRPSRPAPRTPFVRGFVGQRDALWRWQGFGGRAEHVEVDYGKDAAIGCHDGAQETSAGKAMNEVRCALPEAVAADLCGLRATEAHFPARVRGVTRSVSGTERTVARAHAPFRWRKLRDEAESDRTAVAGSREASRRVTAGHRAHRGAIARWSASYRIRRGPLRSAVFPERRSPAYRSANSPEHRDARS